MKAAKVLKILGITRQTLTKYVKEGIIKVHELPTGRYEYDDESVYAFKGTKNEDDRAVAGYVNTWKGGRGPSLESQSNAITEYCKENNIKLDRIYRDEACDYDASSRNGLLSILDEVLHNKIKKIIIYDRDRLSLTEFGVIKHIINESNCAIDIIQEHK